jgi:hypothetical protein
MKIIQLRLLILLVAVPVSVATAYLALWQSLGCHHALSAPNNEFALRVGAVFGLLISIALNCFPMHRLRHPALTVFVVMAGMQLLFGCTFLIWTAVDVSC